MTRSLALLAGLILGALLGYLVGNRTHSAGPALHDLARPAAVDPTPTGPAPALPSRRTAAEVSDAVPDLARLTEAPPLEVPRAAGSATIHGRVIGPDGEGVPGVRIVAHLRTTLKRAVASSAAPRPLDIEDAVTHSAVVWSLTRAFPHETTSAANGDFALEGLPSGAFAVDAALEGWNFEPMTAWSAEAPEAIEVVGRPWSGARLVLLGPGGAPLDGDARARAWIRVGGRDDSRFELLGDADPVLHFDGPHSQLQAFADVDTEVWSTADGLPSRLVSDRRSVWVPPGEVRTVTLELRERAVLVGRVTGDVLDDVEVFAAPRAQGTAIREGALVGDVPTDWTRGDTFQFDVTPGPYALGRLDPSGVARDVIEIDVRPGVNEVALTVTRPELGPHVVARAFAPDGTLVPEAYFRVEWRVLEGGGGAENSRVTADRDGVTRIPFANIRQIDLADPPAATRVWISASHEAFGRAFAPLPRGAREVEVRFEEPVELAVAVRGAEPGRGLTVQLQRTGDGPVSGRGGAAVGPDGRAHFRGLQPGAVLVRLEAQRLVRDSGAAALAEAHLDLAPGSNAVELAAPPLHDLVVRVGPNAGGRSFVLERPDERRHALDGARANAEGELVLRSLPAGSYVLVDRAASAELAIELPSPAVSWDQSNLEVRFVVSAPEPEGWLAQNGLRSDDRIVAIDGERISPGTSFYRQVNTASRRLTVLRGGERTDVEVPRYVEDGARAVGFGGHVRVE